MASQYPIPGGKFGLQKLSIRAHGTEVSANPLQPGGDVNIEMPEKVPPAVGTLIVVGVRLNVQFVEFCPYSIPTEPLPEELALGVTVNTARRGLADWFAATVSGTVTVKEVAVPLSGGTSVIQAESLDIVQLHGELLKVSVTEPFPPAGPIGT
jgi:hypothetical protein